MVITYTFEDLRKQYYKSQQSIFTVSMGDKTADDYEMAAFCQKTSLPYPTEVTSAIRKYFSIKGISGAYSRNLSDLWYDWLGTKGFTQASLRDRQRAFFADGTVNL